MEFTRMTYAAKTVRESSLFNNRGLGGGGGSSGSSSSSGEISHGLQVGLVVSNGGSECIDNRFSLRLESILRFREFL